VVSNANKGNIFTILQTGNRPKCCPRRFLDEDNVEIMIDFKDSIDNDIVFPDLLRKDLEVF